MFYLYMYENKLNGKVSIGQTANINRRKIEHRYGNKTMPIDRAIKKYGEDNFIHSIICFCDTEEQIDQEEIFWIAEMRNILGQRKVYNLANGGKRGLSGKKHTPETIAKMRAIKKGHVPTNTKTGYKLNMTDQDRLNRADRMRKNRQVRTPEDCKQHSETMKAVWANKRGK